MRKDHFDKFAKVADALDDLDQDSRATKVLRTRIHNALDSFSHVFTEEQFTALGGDVPKTE